MTSAGAPEFRDFASALRGLADPAAEPGRELLYMLSGPSAGELAHWRLAWPEIPPERRCRIARRMLDAAEADIQLDFRLLFADLLADTDAGVRATAVAGLWEASDPALVARFGQLVATDADAAVRAQAARALGAFVERAELEGRSSDSLEAALGQLMAAAADPAEALEVRRRAIESLGYADRAEVRLLIARAAGAAETSLRAGALRAMGHSADPDWAPEVLPRLSDADPELRFEAAHAAGELELSEAVPELAILIEGPDRRVQLAAVWALGEIGGERAERALERLAARSDEADEELVTAIEDALSTVALGGETLAFGGFVFDPRPSNGRAAGGRGRAAEDADRAWDEEAADEDDEGDWDEDDLEDDDAAELDWDAADEDDWGEDDADEAELDEDEAEDDDAADWGEDRP